MQVHQPYISTLNLRTFYSMKSMIIRLHYVKWLKYWTTPNASPYNSSRTWAWCRCRSLFPWFTFTPQGTHYPWWPRAHLIFFDASGRTTHISAVLIRRDETALVSIEYFMSPTRHFGRHFLNKSLVQFFNHCHGRMAEWTKLPCCARRGLLPPALLKFKSMLMLSPRADQWYLP